MSLPQLVGDLSGSFAHDLELPDHRAQGLVIPGGIVETDALNESRAIVADDLGEAKRFSALHLREPAEARSHSTTATLCLSTLSFYLVLLLGPSEDKVERQRGKTKTCGRGVSDSVYREVSL